MISNYRTIVQAVNSAKASRESKQPGSRTTFTRNCRCKLSSSSRICRALRRVYALVYRTAAIRITSADSWKCDRIKPQQQRAWLFLLRLHRTPLFFSLRFFTSRLVESKKETLFAFFFSFLLYDTLEVKNWAEVGVFFFFYDYAIPRVAFPTFSLFNFCARRIRSGFYYFIARVQQPLDFFEGRVFYPRNSMVNLRK